MSMEVDKQLLALAWQRVLLDRPHRVFVDHPSILKWMSHDLDAWLEEVSSLLTKGYKPSAALPCPAPKPGFLIRPGCSLEIADELVYAYLVSRLFPKLHGKLIGTQGHPDIAYQLAPDSTASEWMNSDWRIWSQWRKKSLAALDESSVVLVSDIVGFYDNIELSILISDLRDLCGDAPEVHLLHDCLNRWTSPRNRGIPQGYSASHVLAKVYLAGLDSRLKDLGYDHLRYVDDIRVFCSSRLEAQRAITDLAGYLAKRGLSLQSAKTKILTAEDAKVEFDGAGTIIEGLQDQLISELVEVGEAADYVSDLELLQALSNSDSPPVELLEVAFQNHILNGGFNKTLFHYLLTRLGKAKSPIGVDYCVKVLKDRPDETPYALRYIGSIGAGVEVHDSIAEYFKSGSAMYPYQNYQLLRWCLDTQQDHAPYVTLARGWALDASHPRWLRSYALAYLGFAGEAHDLEVLEGMYGEQASEMARADIVAAIRGMEKGRRNGFYSNAQNDGPLVRRAVMWSKAIT